MKSIFIFLNFRLGIVLFFPFIDAVRLTFSSQRFILVSKLLFLGGGCGGGGRVNA